MEIELNSARTANVAFIEVSAGVRYWEDTYINGVADDDGQIPLRNGDLWCPVIDLQTGEVNGWPTGMVADVHYKVCDDGEYWLQDENGARVAKWDGYYVPDDILCVGENGYGDYIIFKIGADGKVTGWKTPVIKADEWTAVQADSQ
jgi:hypothetical protein